MKFKGCRKTLLKIKSGNVFENAPNCHFLSPLCSGLQQQGRRGQLQQAAVPVRPHLRQVPGQVSLPHPQGEIFFSYFLTKFEFLPADFLFAVTGINPLVPKR